MKAQDVLKMCVEEKGVTYTFISEKTGIPVDTISKIFKGKRKLQADELLDICEAVSISIDDFRKRRKTA